MALGFRLSSVAIVVPLSLVAQINVTGVSTSTTQAILQYISPVEAPCTLKVADMDRSIAVISATQSGGLVTLQTNSPHGLLAGAVIYVENSGVSAWDGWQNISSVPTTASFTFANATAGSATRGNIGVLVDDANPTLFPGADQDSRPGNVTTGQTQLAGQTGQSARGSGRSRSFVIGLRYSQFGSDGNRYSRALQANARHHYTLTCGTQSFDQEFRTQNIPLGSTRNDGPLGDRSYPGQYAYPTIQWSNQNQTLIDPVTGLRSFRAASPLGTPSLKQNFVTAIDTQSAWQNPTAPLNNFGGAAMFTGPCPSGTCSLFLRADNFVVSGGAAYADNGSLQYSLDWFTVTIGQASINNPSCAGDDCKIVACLTINGLSCASSNLEASLTGSPANYTFGSGNLMDFWQGSGPPRFSRVEASTASGTINYATATKQATVVSGSPFSVAWTTGSTINIAGAQYTIASVQNERQLTLVNGPTSNLSAVAYSASNFGALIWKKTATADQISIGYTTYLYGSSQMPSWLATPHNPCSPPVRASGVPGSNCFVGQELYWISADGSDVRDMGLVAESDYPPYAFGQGAACGTSDGAYPFDAQNGDVWYCFQSIYFDSHRLSLVKAQYMGSHARGKPGAQIPDCTVSKGVQPCVLFTIMQPNPTDSVNQAGPLFNPDYGASGFVPVTWQFDGVSGDGDVGFHVTSNGQDWPGWLFFYSLGDRTPVGTNPNSAHIVAAASTYRKAPGSWCTIHSVTPPDSGWTEVINNDLLLDGSKGTYNMTLTSTLLNATLGAPGGLNACPPNPFGVTGNVCTAVTVNGPPVSAYDGSVLQNEQIGDIVVLETNAGLHEHMRIVSMTSPTSFIVQRGYPEGAIASHSSTTFTMLCGTRNPNDAAVLLWNYRADPYGTNMSWNTVVNDPVILQAHSYIAGGNPSPPVTIAAGSPFSGLPASICPSGNSCNQVRKGYLAGALTGAQAGVSANPAFAGVMGIGTPNQVDSHPGPCFGVWCMDGRPMDGGDSGVVAPSSSPFSNVSGQLWKVSGKQSILHRKILPTMAYVGRRPLIDVSGPTSALTPAPSDSYKYCAANAANECVQGSAVGDVYVNAPYVSYPYCRSGAIAVPADDTNAICLGDLGAYTGNIEQIGTEQSLDGSNTRNLGPNYAKWNQFHVFWNTATTPNGTVALGYVRWLDGVTAADIVTILPPYPAPDGVTRNTFLPVSVTVAPPARLPAQRAIVEFGYAENGDPGSYYCTSRQETCVAASSSIDPANPFSFEQSESYTGVPCSTGCTIAIPALSQRVVYYRWKYLDNSGQVISSSQVHVAVTQ